MPSELQIQDIADADIDNSKKTLVPLLELALVENLDSNHRRILDRAGKKSYKTQSGKLKVEYDSDEDGEGKLTCRSSRSSTG